MFQPFGYFLSTQVILIAQDLTYISVLRFGGFIELDSTVKSIDIYCLNSVMC